jgi:hypothetical protein
VNRLDDLLDAQRNEHANHDDPDLASEFAPPVQRLGNVEMHAADLERLRHRNRRT